jgi:hypothetical protein
MHDSSLDHIVWGTAVLSSKNYPKVTAEVSSAGIIGLTKCLLHSNIVWKQFHNFVNYPVCWWCSQIELLRKTFYVFPGTLVSMPAQHGECFQVSWQNYGRQPYLLLITLAVVSDLLTDLFIVDLPGAFLHSDVTWNSPWIMITLVVW